MYLMGPGLDPIWSEDQTRSCVIRHNLGCPGYKYICMNICMYICLYASGMQLCLTLCSYLFPSIKMVTYHMQPCGMLFQFSANSVIASREPTSIAQPVQDLYKT